MQELWTQEEESRRLDERFEPLRADRGALAKFARDFDVPGGPSMISQNCSGNRPISLEAAIAYARGFRVKLEDISPRWARVVEAALNAERPATGDGGSGSDGGVVTDEEWRLFQAFKHLKPEEQKEALRHVEEYAAKVLGARQLEMERLARGKPKDNP